MTAAYQTKKDPPSRRARRINPVAAREQFQERKVDHLRRLCH